MELKFRLIKDGKIVGYEKHSYWKDAVSTNRNSIYIYHSRTGHKLSWKNVSMNDEDKNYILHDRKDIFTGFKDKNKKEVYEGDLAKIADFVGYVRYECGTFWLFDEERAEGKFQDIDDSRLEVIGN